MFFVARSSCFGGIGKNFKTKHSFCLVCLSANYTSKSTKNKANMSLSRCVSSPAHLARTPKPNKNNKQDEEEQSDEERSERSEKGEH